MPLKLPTPNSNPVKIASLLATIGLGLGISQAMTSNSLWASPVSAQLKSSQPAMPSESLKTKLISTMQQELGGNPQSFKILKIEPALWQNCLTGANRPNPSPDCKPISQGGWRAQVTGEGETWTYYLTAQGDIQLDGPASISPKARQTLIKTLAYDPKAPLKILAARPFSLVPSCGDSSAFRPCGGRPIPRWQILLEQQPRPLTIDLQGKIIQPSSLKSALPKTLAGLDPIFAEAVLHDVSDRHLGMIPPNLKVESIKPVTWAMCDSGGVPAPGPGPSRPVMGACMVGTASGWQMITRSGPMRWVHYVQPFSMAAWTPGPGFTLASLVSPDGPQSLPKSVADAAIAATARRDKKPIGNYQIHWAEARFFDACLNPAQSAVPATPKSALFCRQRIQPGWQVYLMGPGKTGNPHLSVYHMTLTGNEWRFISSSDWFPPPSAAPVGAPR